MKPLYNTPWKTCNAFQNECKKCIFLWGKARKRIGGNEEKIHLVSGAISFQGNGRSCKGKS